MFNLLACEHECTNKSAKGSKVQNRVMRECMAGASVDISQGRVMRNLDLSIHVYGFLEPSQNETGQQLLFSWALRREHPSFQVWSACTSSRCVHASGKVRVQNCTSQVFSLARNLDLLIHVYGFLQSSQTKPANNYRSHGVYNKNIILSKGLGHFAAVVSLHQPKCQLAST